MNRGGQVLLAPNRHKLITFLRRGHAADVPAETITALLNSAPQLRPARWYSFTRVQLDIDRPIESWSWRRRGVVLDRLEFVWDFAESIDSEDVRAVLRRNHPLGEIADLSYEPFEDDESYRLALSQVDLERARRELRDALRLCDDRISEVRC